MSSHYRYNSEYPTAGKNVYDPTTLQPLLSTLAQYLLLFLLAYFLTFSYSYKNFKELLHMAGNSILTGRAFKSGTLDWTSPVDAKGKGTNGIRRRYVDTQEGREAWESGNLHFPGLLNAAGNLCFLNATLQSMASLPSLITYLDALLLAAESSSTQVAVPVTSALFSTLMALNTPSTSARPPPLRPLLLASALADSSESRRRLLHSSEQQDAHELWGMIRDAVEEESIKVARHVQYDRKLKNGSGLNEVIALKKDGFRLGIEAMGSGIGAGKGQSLETRRENDPWFWLRSQRIKCMTCGYVRDTRHEGEELLMLNVPPVSSCSIYDLLSDYTKPDLLSDYACRKCSMLATLEKYKSKRDRLAGLLPHSEPSESRQTPTNPFEFPETTAKRDTKMTTSRKDRKRKIGKLIDRIQAVVDAGDYEKPLEDDASGGPGGIKMEKVGSAAGKSVNIARTPNVLLIHLNRSTHYGYAGPVKNSCQVEFPEFLDLSPFSDHPTPPSSAKNPIPTLEPESTRDLYRLRSMVVHYGSHHFGHYVAFRRRPDPPRRGNERSSIALESGRLPEWYRISDETVDVSTIEEALRNNPFLLFYERVQAFRQPATRTSDEERIPENPTKGKESKAEAVAGEKTLEESITEGIRPRVIESWRVRSPEIGKRDSDKVEAKAVEGST